MTRSRTLVAAVVAVVLPLLLAACAPAETPPAASDDGPETTADGLSALVLSTALKRGCTKARPAAGFDNVGLERGATAVDFTLKDINGDEYTLSGLLAEKPVVMIFGSFT